MKYGYTCECGWHLDRNTITRREYAKKKEIHAEKCLPAANEIRLSRKMSRLSEEAEPPYHVGAAN
jgi:hypothetical protein